MHFSPEFLISYNLDSSKTLVTVVAEGELTIQRFIAGASPEDTAVSARAIGSLCITQLDSYDQKGITAVLDTIDDWDVF